ncbi:MAG TPA: site-specific integrase [Cyclobacteriaceae bacterium]|jgi:integrase|nr:site-specific integrase [Cyclobacteriaceae bacterium]
MEPQLSIIQDLRHQLKNGEYSVKLRITFKVSRGGKNVWVQKYYGDGFSCTEREFKSLSSPRSDNVRTIKKAMQGLESKARKIITDHPEISVALFESLFFGKSLDTVNGMYEKIITELKSDGHEGTATVHRTALNTFKAFTVYPETKKEAIEAAEIRFSEVGEDWLRKYEKHELKRERTVNYISINLRSLRAVFNRAIKDKVVPKSIYPFDTYRVRDETKFKIPLSEKELAALKDYEPTNPEQFEALDYWKFSYYCNGMNPKDICLIRRNALDVDFIFYDRSKIRNTAKSLKKIVIPFDPEIQAIINRRGAKTLDPNAYIFPILEDGLSSLTIKNRCNKFRKRINKVLGELSNSDKLKFKRPLKLGIARHTFANRMLNGGAQERMIGEALGHRNMQTTEHYLGSMDIEKIKQARKAL